jgi:hypothetical protein
MSVVNAIPLLLGDEGYNISRSVRLRSSASAYFSRTPGSAGNRQIMTFSWWIKLGNFAGSIFGAQTTNNPRFQIYYNGLSDGRFELFQSDGGGSTVSYVLNTARSRDTSAWYHFVVSIDTTQGTASNRVKWYQNGVQLTSFDTASYPAQNTNFDWNSSGTVHNIGRQPNASGYVDGYLTEINFIDGQALTPSSFGEIDAITGVWKPKKYAGTYGTNGFYLNFSDNSSNTAATIGKDYSGNGNNWTPNNISVTSGATYDSMLDVPTLWADGGNGRGNYATLNPLNINRPTIIDGNLRVTGGDLIGLSTIGMTSGAWYAEMTVTTVGTETSCGIAQAPTGGTGSSYVGSTATSWGYYAGNGNKYTNASSATYGATYTSGDVIGIAFDADAGTLTFYKNGTTQGAAYTGLTSGPYYFAVSGRTSGTANNVSINFGQRPFAYTPPSGFKALNTLNLPEPTIKKGNLYFDAKTYTGNGSTQSITGMAFAPDLVWIKSRSRADPHDVYDTVRGAPKALYPNLTDAEYTVANGFQSFDSAGFSLNGSGGGGNVNFNGATYVGWQWKEGATQGFDIVTYTGTGVNRTVAHSLGVAPSMMIVKRRDSATNGDWFTYHASLGNANAVYLNLTNASAGSGGAWNNTSPTSSVFTVGTSTGVNANGSTYVAYLFAEVAGFSRFGSYTGNGSADGPFVFCGFAPAFIMLKRTDSTGNWTMYDRARSTRNPDTKVLYPNLSNAEDASTDHFDWLSNGFKMKSTNQNTNGGTFIFMAMAEHPFKLSLAR